MTGDQLGFDTLLEDAAAENAARLFERETAHLPDTWEDALIFHQQQITEHHAAMLANNFDAAIAIRGEAYLLARKLAPERHGILSSDDAPGCKLDREAAAQDGTIPLWGQSGSFVIVAAGMTARVEMNGMFSIGATAMPYLGFAVRAVDDTQPFLSQTGYRSFLGCSVPAELNMTTDGFVKRMIEAFVDQDLRGKLLTVDREWFQK